MKDHKVRSIVMYVELPCLNDFSFSGNCLYEFEKSVKSYLHNAQKEVLDVLKKAKDEAKSEGYKEPFVEFKGSSTEYYYDNTEFNPAELSIKAYRPMTDKEKAVKLKNSKAAKKARKAKADKVRDKDLKLLAKLKEKYE